MLLHLASNILIENLRVGIAHAADEIVPAEGRWAQLLYEILPSPLDGADYFRWRKIRSRADEELNRI
jgi:hypothetical protein